ncbi:receptor-type tyrosine-protein phosphatase S-like [Branchiostoma floridae x Branchiostoma belcheri]
MGWKEGVVPMFCVAWLGLITGVVGTTPPQDCADLFAAGTRQSGTYTVGEPSPYRVYCDMSFLGGGWTVLQRRQDGSVDFAKTWEEYQQGFGDLTGEFWLGLDNIHTLTTVKSNNILQIELEDFDGGRKYARYNTFSVGDASGNYVVSISGYSGDAGNSLTNSGRPDINGRMFSTIDRDNDGNAGGDCANLFSNGGWWYPVSCGLSFLNGRYNCHQSSVSCAASQGVVWSRWGGASYFLKKTTIMVRPADFTGSNVPDDCADLYEAGIIESGVNAVSDPRIFVYCDMMKAGGGWTVFQRRQDGSVDFAKNWADYQQGFGDLTGEHWLGLSKQNQITGQKAYSLRVDLGDWENKFRYATYSNFGVGSSSTDYQVSISGYSGDAGDSLTSGGSRFNINGIKFTTSDDNNGPNSNNCATRFGGGGWWFPDSCGYALLNGRYNGSGNAQGVNWERWRGYGYSLKMSSLKVRPASFSVCPVAGTFGDCSSTCRCLDGNAACNQRTGSCLGLCARGWMGSDCQTACSPGTYGPSCSGTCRCSGGDAACNIETGVCSPAGCIDGWTGDSCDTAPAQFMEPVPQDQVKDAGQSVSWTCRANGYPLPDVTWQHGGNDLTADGSDITIVTSHGSSGNDVYTESTLTISSVGRQHDGAYTCSASNIGASPQTSFSLAVRDTPDKPSVNSGFVSELTSITITWSFPAYTGNLDIIGSLIEYRTMEGTTWTTETKERQINTHTFSNLQPFTVFEVRVSVQNARGYSDTTDPVRIWSAPGKVQQLDREIISVSEMRLTWASPDPTKPQDIISRYEVAFGTSEDTIGDPLVTTDGETLTKTLSDLTPGNTYICKVWAVTAAGRGDEKTKHILFEYVPSQPLNVEVNNVGDCACLSGRITDKASVTVSWDEPASPNGQIVGYHLSYSTDGQSETLQTFTTNDVTQQINNLQLHSKYTLRVAAYNSLFNGTESEVATETTNEGCPGPPVDVQAEQMSVDSAVHCNISWAAPRVINGVIAGYKVHYRTSWNQVPSYSNENTEAVSEATVTNAMTVIKELGPNKKLSVRVSATTCNDGESSVESEFVCVNAAIAPPPPPPLPDVPQDEITSSSFKMDIQRASSENGPICCYQIIVVPMTSEETLETLRSIGLRENTVLTSETTDIAAGRRDLPYVADAFSSEEFSSSITVGNEQRCENDCCNIGPTGHPDGNVHNKALSPNTMYTVTVRAFSMCTNGRRKRQAESAGSDTFTSSEFITPQQTESGSGGPGPVTSVAGPVVGGIVGVIAVAAIVAGVIIGRRKCPLLRKRDSTGGSSSSSGVRGIDNLAQLENLAPDENPDHAKPPVAPRKPEPKRHGAAAAKATAASASVRDYEQPVPVECLEHEFNRRHANDDQLFTEEYKALPDNLGMVHAKAYLKKANGEKNRFKNVIAYDNNRVVLTPVEGDPDSDYIHASYIDGYKEERKFIAAQGPKPNTVHDFWRMMWETGSTVIVMVTNLEEKGKIKCTKYWPDSGDEVYGQICVTLAETIPMVYYVSRVFLVSKGEEKKRKITQFQFLGWPDFGAPRNPAELLKFHQKVMTSITSRERPIVVHCSAGVGRTGTFITMDAMLEMMAEEGKVDVFGFVSKTRQSRSQMVQAEAQYIFIYRALLEQYLYGDTEVEVASIHRHLQNLKREDEDSRKTGLEMEFEKLTSIPIDKANMRNGNLPENISKNRLLQVLPYDTSRVFLLHKTGMTGSDYINASFIDGYREKDAYIATQGPLDRTVEDFWRMVWEWNSCSIVMLTELQEKQRSTCARYWPTEGSKTYGDLTVRLDDTGEFGDFTRRTFSLEDGKSEKSRTIHQFHFHAWPQYGAPDNAAGIIDLIGQVQKQQQLSGNGPITVHCSSGAGRTGTFCAISTVLEQVKTEGTCDVFQTVKALRQQRPHMVQTIDQYQFCYQAIVEYLDSFDHYSNFS